MPGQQENNSIRGPLEASISASLLHHLQRGDGDAWKRLVWLFGPRVYQWCRAAGLQPDDAADVGQEVFRAVASGIRTFRRHGPGDTFSGWLWKITQYKLQDYWRYQARQPQAFGGSSAQLLIGQLADPLSYDSGTGSTASDVNLLMAALEMVQAEVESRTWQAFWLVTIEGWTATEAADRLEMTRGAVYVAKSRVLRRLRIELDGLLALEGSP